MLHCIKLILKSTFVSELLSSLQFSSKTLKLCQILTSKNCLCRYTISPAHIPILLGLFTKHILWLRAWKHQHFNYEIVNDVACTFYALPLPWKRSLPSRWDLPGCLSPQSLGTPPGRSTMTAVHRCMSGWQTPLLVVLGVSKLGFY